MRQFTVAHLMPGTYYGFQVQSTIQNLDNVSTICNDVNFFKRRGKHLLLRLILCVLEGKLMLPTTGLFMHEMCLNMC